MTYAQVPTNGLMACFPFSGNANDTTGNGYNGTVSGATLTTDRFGNSNRAYSFNGTSDFIYVPTSPITTDNPFTISSWIYVNSTNTDFPIVALGDNGTQTLNELSFSVYPTNNLTAETPGANDITSTGATITMGQWVHAVVVHNATGYTTSNFQFYLNGIEYTSNTNDGTNDPFSLNNYFSIGRNHGGGNSSFANGNIDDIAIYNRALSSTEIQQLYNLPNPQISINGLIASYPFSGNANDTSGNNLNGTVYGATLTTDRFGNANYAYSFDSSNYIEVANNSILDNNQGSICFWIKDSTPPNSHGCAVIYKDDQSNGVMVNEYSSAYDIGVIDYSSGVQVGMTVTPITFDTNWHFCVFTYQINGNKYSYLDGVQIGSDTVGSFNFTSTTAMRFGLAQDTWWDAYTGVLDDIMIYDRAISPTEIQALYGNYSTTGTTSIISSASTIGVKIYPNPATDFIKVENVNSGTYSLRIINSLSQQVVTSNISQNLTTIDISGLNSGLYFVQILDVNSNTTEVQKLIVE